MNTEWTDQTAFDAAYVHCMEQKVRSVDTRDCLYRGPNGTKCAVGCLIPDDLYHEDMEGSSGAGVVMSIGWAHLSMGLIDSIQNAHDTFLDPDDLSVFRSKMEETAKDYGLEWSHD